MYIGDRHINFDRYYDASDYDDDPETEEEIAAAEAEAAAERKAQAQVAEWTKAAQAAGIDLEKYKERLQP